ncbi:unnamed protein product [Cuscuta campestris]|uniref:Uncharacterized protein n=1 Tax=Cuscuta campestris TaxID=132261 RepID=A0A484MMX2_9ASTE|nr:unnamed protein product [Cuscuta campestris]
MAEFLGKGFRIHHPDAVGGISLTHNRDPQKYMVMHYHSVGNGFRLPLHGLVRYICQTFEFPLVNSPPTAAAPQGMEKEVGGKKEPKEQHSTTAISPSCVGSRRKRILSSGRVGQTQQSLLTLTEEYLGGAWGKYRAMEVLKDKVLAARALQLKVGSLEQQVHALQEENARLKADASAELLAERSRVKSMQEQIVTYQGSTQDLEAQFDKLRGQISCLESKVSTLEGKEGSVKDELVERESRISELEKSLHEAKQEGAHFSEVMLKHMGLKREALQKLENERKIANELRLKVGELEKTVASHQGEVATLTARAEALYEEGKFDMQFCIYEAVRSGLPAHQTLNDFISYYGLPLPLPPPDSRANPGPWFSPSPTVAIFYFVIF